MKNNENTNSENTDNENTNSENASNENMSSGNMSNNPGNKYKNENISGNTFDGVFNEFLNNVSEDMEFDMNLSKQYERVGKMFSALYLAMASEIDKDLAAKFTETFIGGWVYNMFGSERR